MKSQKGWDVELPSLLDTTRTAELSAVHAGQLKFTSLSNHSVRNQINAYDVLPFNL